VSRSSAKRLKRRRISPAQRSRRNRKARERTAAKSDGKTKGYSRRQGGKTVFVHDYKTPEHK